MITIFIKVKIIKIPTFKKIVRKNSLKWNHGA